MEKLKRQQNLNQTFDQQKNQFELDSNALSNRSKNEFDPERGSNNKTVNFAKDSFKNHDDVNSAHLNSNRLSNKYDRENDEFYQDELRNKSALIIQNAYRGYRDRHNFKNRLKSNTLEDIE